MVEATDTTITVKVTECYLHCAKAFMRSKLWQEYEPPAADVKSAEEFCSLTRFMLVATTDENLGADMSPKGDQAAKLLNLNDDFVWYADRPGNRRVDGFRNILTFSQIEILALIAGSDQVLRVTGKAELFSEHSHKDFFTEKDKVPRLIVRIKPEQVALEKSAALARAKLWPPQPSTHEFKASEIWQAHMKLSKITGLEATLAKAAISIPGALDVALDFDYKNNMY